MDAILFIGHGSREQAGNEQLLAFTKKVEEVLRQRTDVPIFESCFLELTVPTIATGIRRCVERGATRIAAVPIMLFSAGHAKLHIPHELDEAREKYPHVTFTYGRPIGVHENIIEILLDRLKNVQGETVLEQAATAVAGTASPLSVVNQSALKEQGHPLSETAILLVGRGSSDADANSELYKIGRLLWEASGVADLEFAYMGVTRPTPEEGLERCLRGGAKKVYVLPYLLFTGVLMNRLNDLLAAFRENRPDVRVVLAEFLGFHDHLTELVAERAIEALEGKAAANCDMCAFRKMVVFDHHHHHDHDHDHHHHHDHDHDHHHHHDHDHAHHHHHDHRHDHHHHDHDHHHDHHDHDPHDHHNPSGKKEGASS
ncbi:sirohydrochlorin chelatase [Brevibacillus fluminis]|uniref:sirohydrochlorin chelatase n=1 Tax=Brevibacillus fluminis TaxID=511487 RepID=UPI003F8A23DA